jgi:hypothetical protein
MTTFKQFLTDEILTGWDTTDLTVKKAIALLNKHCKNGLKVITNGSVMYRGFGKHPPSSDFAIIDSSKVERTSRDTDNTYQLLMDISPALSGFPKRSQSLICTTVWKDTAIYGPDRRIIVPYDGTAIATTPSRDFFGQTVDSSIFAGEVVSIAMRISRFMRGLQIYPNHKEKSYTDAVVLNRELATRSDEDILMNARIELHLSGNVLDRFLQLMDKRKTDRFTAIAESMMTPENMGIRLTEFGNPLEMGECWFSGKCIVIASKLFEQILQQLNTTGFDINTIVADTWDIEK